MRSARLCLLVPLAVAVAGFGFLAFLAAIGWPGDVEAAGAGFCEAVRPGAIRQPVNTWSNAGFLALGVWVGWQSWRDVVARKSPAWRNRMVTTWHFPAAVAGCSVFIGVGSSALHASTTEWAAELDHFAMHVWGTWCIAYALTRLFRADDQDFYRIWVALVGGVVVRWLLGRPYVIYGSTLFAAMIVMAILIEVVGRWWNRRLTQLDTPYLVWAVVIFALADVCRRVGTEANSSCNPYSVWQGHAAWHVLCAGATAFVYLYARSERVVETEPVIASSVAADS